MKSRRNPAPVASYAALMPDGTIQLAPTQQGAMRKIKESGFHGKVVVEEAPLPRQHALRNEGEYTSESLKSVLKSAGLPAYLSEEEVMSISLKEATDRLYRIFRFLRVEQIEPVPEGEEADAGAFFADEGGGKKKKKYRRVKDEHGRFVYGRVQWVEGKVDRAAGRQKARSATDYAKALIGVNLKLVKGTTSPSSIYSEVTERDAYLIGVNLFPADKLVEEGEFGFMARYPHVPYSQIIRSIRDTGKVPEYVVNIPTGHKQERVRERLDLTDTQVRNLQNAFYGPKGPKKFTFCSGASESCKKACLVYAGQNTAAHKNDWKKAATALALIADPAAYVRLMIEAIRLAQKNVEDEPGRTMRATKKKYGTDVEVVQKRFFVRLNLLSDIPWEAMIPWMFDRFPKVQFYDYTKVFIRKPPPNYNLTYSYSGDNLVQLKKKLYGERPERAAVVFLGYLLENGTAVVASKPKGEAGYGYGLPTATDMFAPPHLVGKEEGMLLVTNADKHDARPLDPPNRAWPHSTIAGLVFKSPGGGETTSREKMAEVEEQRNTAFVTPTLIVPGEARFEVDFAGKVRSGEHVRSNGRRKTTARINGQRVVGLIIAPEAPRFEGPAGNADSGVA